MDDHAAAPTTPTTPALASAVEVPSRRRLRAEVLIVLGLSLGYYAITAALRLVERYLAEPSIGQQTSQLNPSRSQIDYIDLILQVVRQFYLLVPVALVLFLLSAGGKSALRRLGITGHEHSAWRDLGMGLVLAAAIGLPGLVLYAVGRAIGQTVRIDTSGLPDAWWTATILLFSAAVAGVLEETIAVGYLVTRLQDMRWSATGAIVASALLRGAYHLYQGWPMALGNVVMGLVFAWYFHRTGRLGPLIIAHWTLDAVSFIGPELVPEEWLVELGVA
ncbi:CPBP family intramembrane glutamic endopeptidase [Demequina aestuarii]|uniref:CPBP family intramembrane glutamic endopeptidase n=1 Tax=Demequina aestuarii TaxID=327095 RepID=UPI0007859190|nr:CPBP family intramembrane glutamic endopeptidase [Demequina aestuarii]